MPDINSIDIQALFSQKDMKKPPLCLHFTTQCIILYTLCQVYLTCKIWMLQIAYNSPSMTVAVRSFAKINLGLYIGAARADGFHDLRTVYQTIPLHDVIRFSVGPGSA